MAPAPHGGKPQQGKKKFAPARTAGTPEWFQDGLLHALDASAGLTTAGDPRTLDQATAELLGEHMQAALRRDEPRFFFWWAELLTRAATDAVADALADTAAAEPASWRGPSSCCTA